MKGFIKILGIVAFITMVGFVMIACGDGDDNEGIRQFVGTWVEQDVQKLVFTAASNWTHTIADMQMAAGTFTVSGNTADLRLAIGGGTYATAKVSGDTLTFTIAGVTSEFTRQEP